MSAEPSQSLDMERLPSAVRMGDTGQPRARPLQVDPHDPIYQAMMAAAKAPTPPPAAAPTLPHPAAAPATLPGPSHYPNHPHHAAALPMAHGSPAVPKVCTLSEAELGAVTKCGNDLVPTATRAFVINHLECYRIFKINVQRLSGLANSSAYSPHAAYS